MTSEEVKTKVTTRRNRNTRTTSQGWQERFLKFLCEIPNVSFACERARVSRVEAYERRKTDPAFAKAWEDAVEAGIDGLETAAFDRSRNGTERGVWMKDQDGKPTCVEKVKDYPESLTQFLLKAHRPAKYREQRDVLNLNATTTAPDGTKAELVVHLSAEELP